MAIYSFPFKQHKASELFVWQVSESYTELVLLAKAKAIPFKPEQFKLEKNAINYLVKHLLMQHCFGANYQLNSSLNGKPLPFIGKHITFSHSKDFLLLAVADTNIGADIQAFDEKLVVVRSKYLSDLEYNRYEELSQSLAYLQVLWSAKEAVFKLYGENLPFKDIESSVFTPNAFGELVFTVNGIHKHTVSYVFYGIYCCCIAV